MADDDALFREHRCGADVNPTGDSRRCLKAQFPGVLPTFMRIGRPTRKRFRAIFRVDKPPPLFARTLFGGKSTDQTETRVSVNTAAFGVGLEDAHRRTVTQGAKTFLAFHRYYVRPLLYCFARVNTAPQSVTLFSFGERNQELLGNYNDLKVNLFCPDTHLIRINRRCFHDVFSISKRRCKFNHAKVRSTTHRRASTTKPSCSSRRKTTCKTKRKCAVTHRAGDGPR